MGKSILLCGLSGTGKTTLAKQLSEDFEAKLTTESDIIHTEIRKRIPFLRKSEQDIDSLEYKITQIMTKVYQSVEILIVSRQSNLIIDACHLTESARSKISKLLPESPILIYVTCDEDTLLDRLNQKNNPEVWQNLHEKQKQMFEIPSHPDIVYHTSQQDYEDIKSKIQKQLQ